MEEKSKSSKGEEEEKSNGFSAIHSPYAHNLAFFISHSNLCLPTTNDDKYRCSETGYRIPLKCLETEGGPKDTNVKKTQKGRSTLEISVNSVKPHVMLHDGEELITSIKHRSLLDDPSSSKGKSEAYITYRSCIPAVNEEKLSVLGFEGILLCLLSMSGSAVYFRRKRTVAMPGVGAGRIPTNSRF
ncbi:hypothetical protein EZV62_017710 [Acer yangbiense]|uniref:Uncharacterized protein n=1 Tax=Acer yangbiense TaxID=1000413 RepID=A0A5C7HHE2_9ROSI|nr:hypothetical protein EZV62_017710 [Acer yangbiense]